MQGMSYISTPYTLWIEGSFIDCVSFFPGLGFNMCRPRQDSVASGRSVRGQSQSRLCYCYVPFSMQPSSRSAVLLSSCSHIRLGSHFTILGTVGCKCSGLVSCLMSSLPGNHKSWGSLCQPRFAWVKRSPGDSSISQRNQSSWCSNFAGCFGNASKRCVSPKRWALGRGSGQRCYKLLEVYKCL